MRCTFTPAEIMSAEIYKIPTNTSIGKFGKGGKKNIVPMRHCTELQEWMRFLRAYQVSS